MIKKISWRRAVPLFAIGVLSAGVVSLSLNTHLTSAQRDDDQYRHSHSKYKTEAKYYLKLDGVTGGSMDADHKGEIELNSYRILEDGDDTPEALSDTPLAAFGDNNLRFLADASKASPVLFEKAATKAVIPTATLTVKGGKYNKDYFVMKMTNVMVASYQNSANDEFGNLDEVVLDYGSLTLTHKDGSPVSKGWDFQNKKEVQ
jgi:type VI protein secretion system component Hcp